MVYKYIIFKTFHTDKRKNIYLKLLEKMKFFTFTNSTRKIFIENNQH